MNILAIGAHFDDIELGCGGAIAKHVSCGDTVYAFVATKSGFSNYDNKLIRSENVALNEAKIAMDELGVKEMFCGNFEALNVEFEDSLNIQIIRIVEEKKIDTVYTHWIGDIHHDHQAVARSSLHSCRHISRLVMYRSNWYHSPYDFRGNFYIDISLVWDIKERAIRAHASEINRTGEKWIKFFKNEATNAGQRIGVDYAEVFEIVKWKLI